MSVVVLDGSIPPNPGLPAPFVGEVCGDLEASLCPAIATNPRGVHDSASACGVELRFSLDGVVEVATWAATAAIFGGGATGATGVECRSGDGDAGLSGRRKGDALGEPKERGEGLYEAAIS